MEPAPTVFVVAHDPACRDTARTLVESVNLPVETFESAQEFLAAYEPHREGCVVIDAHLPGMTGLDLQAKLVELGHSIPVIMLSGPGDLTVAVLAMRAGAVSVLGKPYNRQVMIDTIHAAMERNAKTRGDQARNSEIKARIARLTPRQREVMDLLLTGKISKEIAAKLRLRPKTVEMHRGHVMRKMQAETLADLFRIIHTAGG